MYNLKASLELANSDKRYLSLAKRLWLLRNSVLDRNDSDNGADLGMFAKYF